MTTGAALVTEHPGQWRLARVEVVNWGTFDGHYGIDIARRGHLFTGASGSGKSSLLDAIATVLTPHRMLRFNAAAQEAATRNDDRSFVSYVRGAWSREADAELDRAVSSYLRNGARWSGVLLRFENGRDAPVNAARLFHIRSGSVDMADLKDMAFIGRDAVGLLDFAPFVESGIDVRAVKKRWPEAVSTTNGAHAAYFSRLTRLLGIASETALQLLHRTQSAKNLGTLDQLFRNFMLDRPSTFDRATNAVRQFGELRTAHALVVEARDQVAALRALEPFIEAYERAEGEVNLTRRLTELLPAYQGRLELRLTEVERASTSGEYARAEAEADQAESIATRSAEGQQAARRAIYDLGGAEAERAQERVDEAEATAERVHASWQRLADELSAVGLAAPQDAAEYAELREAARHELDHGETPPPVHEHDQQREYFEAKRAIDRIDRELEALKARRSNLPAGLLHVRRALSKALDVSERSLPFAGELIEVRPEFAAWTGAIERVLHPLATTLLVRDDLLARVRTFVDAEHLGTRLVYEAVPSISEPPRRTRSARSLLHRVIVGAGSFEGWMQWRLAAEYDFDCVDGAADLDTVERGLTIRGQVKRSARRYEKNDRTAVDDRTSWVLGADNDAKVEALLEQRRVTEQRMRRAEGLLDAAQQAVRLHDRRRTVLENLRDRQWGEIDRASAQDAVAVRREQLLRSTAGNLDLQRAVEIERVASDDHDRATAESRRARRAADRLRETLSELDTRLVELSGQGHREVPEDESSELDRRFRAIRRSLDRRSVAEIGQQITADLFRSLQRATETSARSRIDFEEGAAEFRRHWQAAAADLTRSIDDRAGYQALRSEIEARGLPEHEQNFQRLLREKSRETVGHLLSDIRDAPKLVKERIEPVNASLGISEFDRERFLRIRVREQRSPEVQTFIADLRSVVDGAWADEEIAAAEARFGILERLMFRLGSSERADTEWRRRCLDTREHVVFQAEEIDRAGRVENVHDSSAGLSGGQRQKLVIFCLAAALRYQLTQDERSVPIYGTIVLDEAFDKADARYTRMAMDIFVAFGFHMILATPQKLLSTIEPYVGAMSSIANETRRKSSIANLVFGGGEPE